MTITGGVPLDFTNSDLMRSIITASAKGTSGDVVPYSEDALALQFAGRHGGDLRFCNAWGRWYRYNGTCWTEERTLQAFDLARRICRDNCDGAPDAAKRRLSDGSTVAAVVKLASSDRQLATVPEQWNEADYLLPTPGGTINLRTGEMCRNNPLDYFTMAARVTPEHGKPERFLQHLDECLEGDTPLIDYLQKVGGLCISGETKYQQMWFMWGSGGNGKGVVINAWSDILGGFAKVTDSRYFTESKVSHHREGLARLVGARLCTMRETERGHSWDESQLKTVTGADAITANFMRQNSFEFKPKFKLIVSGQHKPRIKSCDDAMRRRLRIINFNRTFKENPDLELGQKLVPEYGRILNWLIEGALKLQREGLTPPASVASATGEYFNDEDSVGQWLTDNAKLGRGESCKTGDAYADWAAWCQTQGIKSVGTATGLTQDLKTRGGITYLRHGGQSMFKGLSLISVRPSGGDYD